MRRVCHADAQHAIPLLLLEIAQRVGSADDVWVSAVDSLHHALRVDPEHLLAAPVHVQVLHDLNHNLQLHKVGGGGGGVVHASILCFPPWCR